RPQPPHAGNSLPPGDRHRGRPDRLRGRRRAQDAPAREGRRARDRRRLRPADLARLVALAAMWGASYLFMRYAVPHLGPALLIELRVLVAGSALAAFLYATGGRIDWGTHWRAYLFVG